nr:hypothetical protein CFP56_01005 [Quercus suber]
MAMWAFTFKHATCWGCLKLQHSLIEHVGDQIRQGKPQAKMSADHDGDSQMLSSPSDTSDNEVATPQSQVPPTSSGNILSPPDSQHRETRSTMSESAHGASIANSNGKRPLQTISNGLDDDLNSQDLAKAPGTERVLEHPAKMVSSGYSWTRAEDEPGWSWLNKKAIDEHHRAYDSLLHREINIGSGF